MKQLFVIICTLISIQAFAADTLKCKSTNGSTLEWSKVYGELVATGPRGEFIADQDALKIGRSHRSGNGTITDIVFGDESDYDVFAMIVKNASETSIILDGMKFVCR